MTLRLVQKNSGYRQKFSLEKLSRSIADALKHCEAGDGKLAERLAHETQEYLEGKGREMVEVEEIRQTVLHILRQDGHAKGAQSYELISLHLGSPKIHTVIKRSGAREPLHAYKIFKSLKKSFADAGLEGGKISEELTKEIIKILEETYAGQAVPVEIVRKIAAQLLKEKGYKSVERSYLLHKYL